MFKSVLIANRGEIACRIIRTLREMGVQSVCVYAESDAQSLHVKQADLAVSLGEGNVSQTYLDADKIIEIAQKYQCEAVIPGYGFLSENAEFARECEAQGIAFVGPTPEQMQQFGLKHSSRELCEKAGVPVTPGTGLLQDLDDALRAADTLGFPLMLKSTAGGGGIGLQRCDDEDTLIDVFETTRRLGENYFKDAGVFLERFVASARHIEVQIIGDGEGKVIALGERDCSLQRRNQKVIEECPAPNLPEATRQKMHDAAIALGKSVNYRNVGTVEFIYDVALDEFYFLEVNSRLQVEHPVTEAVFGIDLVHWMLAVAAKEAPEALVTETAPAASGWAIEARVYAEEPLHDFQPSPGELTWVDFSKAKAAGARVDTWVESGVEVSAFYDPLLAKVIVEGDDRDTAIKALHHALSCSELAGISTNLDYLRQLSDWNLWHCAKMTTNSLLSFIYQPRCIEVQAAGTYTSVQDFPGRKGYWDIGVPPSGPMDDFAFRLGNRIVGNHESAAGLECTIIGPVLKFHAPAVVALTGADTDATLDGQPVLPWTPIMIQPDQVLNVGKAKNGCRTYVSIRFGLDVPEYLGSRSTFALGQFGGFAGRILRKGDMLPVSDPSIASCATPCPVTTPAAAPVALIPTYPEEASERVWEIGVMYGPHGAPDFFQSESIEMFFNTAWEVHYNSNRLGIRLNGPKPTFTRSDGGEAGLHPSNIHDCEYAIGAVNFTGDMPVILTHDGPSLGGFVCPVTIIQSELWKVGQVRPGEKIRFVPVTADAAVAQEKARDRAIAELSPPTVTDISTLSVSEITVSEGESSPCILAHIPASNSIPEVLIRQAGDKYVLIEIGEMALDLTYRFVIHAMMQAIKEKDVPGICEQAPGVRSLQIRYDSRILSQALLLTELREVVANLPAVESMSVNTRVVHLPMAFEDSATLDAVDKYRQSVRDTAPWLPNNVDFMQRINGLETREQVRDTLFEASYMVLGLGDVYLGAPCAVPVDPRHRLLTSKYNPARTFTAEGTVGIGGVYMCIYGMDSPGGYQLVGRTLPIWNKYLKNKQFSAGEPWLLRFFDQVRYYQVSENELHRLRDAFREGQHEIKITEETFSLSEHLQFLTENADSIAAFKEKQQAAFTEEVARWALEPAFELQETNTTAEQSAVEGTVVEAEMCGNIWKVEVAAGQAVKKGDLLIIVEAMKMEFPIYATCDGVISDVVCQVGSSVVPGQSLLGINETALTD